MRTLIKFGMVTMMAAACCLPAEESATSGSAAPYVIPNLKVWEQVQEGMTVEQLEGLLGKPLTKTGPKGDWEPDVVHEWTFGYVAKKSPVQPEDLTFSVRMEMGKVWSKEDPFGGAPLSTDGTPTVPVLMTPKKDALLVHYPRIVDFRWYPASGDYPMKYELEVDFFSPSRGWVQKPENARECVERTRHKEVTGGGRSGGHGEKNMNYSRGTLGCEHARWTRGFSRTFTGRQKEHAMHFPFVAF